MKGLAITNAYQILEDVLHKILRFVLAACIFESFNLLYYDKMCYDRINGHRLLLKVIFRTRSQGSSAQAAMQCSNINVEIHTSCKCGCDVEAANCNRHQVIRVTH